MGHFFEGEGVTNRCVGKLNHVCLDALYFNTYHAGHWFLLSKNVFLKLQCLFHEIINQYQACLYSVECISHGDSKYCHEIPQF